MNIRSQIFDAADRHAVLVFPTQVSAKSWVREYTGENPEKAVFTDRFLSWDSFKDSCTGYPSERKPASWAVRHLFAAVFFSTPLSARLKYFADSSYPQTRPSFEKRLASVLPDLFTSLQHGVFEMLPEDVKNDVILITGAYSEFLENNGFYEKSQFAPDFSKAEEDTVLFFPSAYPDPEVLKAIEQSRTGKGKISIVENGDGYAPLEVFDNPLCEIRETLRRIYGLLQEGVKAEEITVTLADTDNMLPLLLSEAKLRGIMLNPIGGKPLDAYSAGRLFEAISRCEAENYSMDAVKSLLLEPSYPFKDAALALKTVEKGIVCRVDDGYRRAANWVRRLSQNNSEDCAAFIKKVANLCGGICNAKSPHLLREAVSAFQTELFTDGSFRSADREPDVQVFSRCMDSLNDLDALWENRSFETLSSVFDIFRRILSSTVYTPDAKRKGIRVCTYRTTSCYGARYHFVLGLDSGNTTFSRSRVPYLNEFSSPEDVQETGDEILKSYSGMNEPEPDSESESEQKQKKLYLSCSENNFSRSTGAPSFFIERNLICRTKQVVSDAFSEEKRLWAQGCREKTEIKAVAVQKKRSEKSLPVLIGNAKRKDAVIELPQDVSQGEVRLSATIISDFLLCPYRWACAHVLKLEDKEYDVEMNDYAGTGQFLHGIYEDFLTSAVKLDNVNKPENDVLYSEIFKKHLDSYSRGATAPDELHVMRLSLKYRDIMRSLASVSGAKKLTGSSFDSLEKEFTFSGDGYRISGRIDCILRFAGDEFAVLDFKKKNVDKTSMQLVIYAKMLENSKDYLRIPVLGAFYSIEEEKYYVQWSDSVKFIGEFAGKFDETVAEIVKQIRAGKVKATPSEDNCVNCSYSRICRKRYVVK
ncbi:MAG: PD-(D/E)XK nuclease family protein [Sphaerochaetaceae bacterium]|nr:PD-(D/E)XK nuclease family protein [Sphaerochaetaceae bacterium]